MAQKQSNFNPPLATLIVVGVAVLIIGIIVTGQAPEPQESLFEDPVPAEKSVAGPFLMGLGGTMVVMGWAAGAICYQLIRQSDEDRGE
ncbi:hypothetical protein [Glycomyces salinus]|uniref:hypothetical protein n=1 Tax=Glycomyces salinus TaxID=980294 RepID=UPI0018EBBA05|nr:hypothetical protein [Glycomyces salinus]